MPVRKLPTWPATPLLPLRVPLTPLRVPLTLLPVPLRVPLTLLPVPLAPLLLLLRTLLPLLRPLPTEPATHSRFGKGVRTSVRAPFLFGLTLFRIDLTPTDQGA
jgi:hypothetical protein